MNLMAHNPYRPSESDSHMSFPKEIVPHLESTYTLLLSGCAPKDTARRMPDSEWSQACADLRKSAEASSLSSLAFAISRLEYWRANGIQSINVAGTMGSGKSSIAKKLAALLNFDFKDADLFHPEEKKEKMSRGVPLTHADRHPFYTGVQGWLKEPRRITSCSALAHMYRALISGQDIGVLLNESDAAWRDPWKIETPNFGMFPVIVTKPYDVALYELDAANKSEKGYRELDGKRHYIQVTKETEALAQAEGKTPLLKSQYQLLERDPMYAWDAYVLESISLQSSDGSYSNDDSVNVLLDVLPHSSNG